MALISMGTVRLVLRKVNLHTTLNGKLLKRDISAVISTVVRPLGMRESEITKTSIGKYSKTGGNYKGSKRCNLYYWFNSKGEQIYAVRCCDGEVIQVWDDRDDPRSFKVNSTKPYYNSSNYDDEYNVKDYYSAEDFYDDHYDDFFDYYDAENYYLEHGGF